jgi:uncharacterized protein GlcG (DUF336 family)
VARFPVDLVDASRGPTASQTAGLTLAAARAVMAAVEAEARALGVAMTCAVVDSGDQLVAFERMDGADLVGVTLARDKAFTALLNRMPTRDLAPIVQPGTEYYGYDSVAGGRTIVFAGGMPLERDGVLVGRGRRQRRGRRSGSASPCRGALGARAEARWVPVPRRAGCPCRGAPAAPGPGPGPAASRAGGARAGQPG